MENQQHLESVPETGQDQTSPPEEQTGGGRTDTGGDPRQPQQPPEQPAGDANTPPHHPWNMAPLPPGYALDPATGWIVPIGPWPHHHPHGPASYHPPHPGYAGYAGHVHPGPAHVMPESPQQAAARQAAHQQQQGAILQSFEHFMEGKATVSDVVKTLYTNTADNDQFWKGALVGAAVAVLLSSKPVREAMSKTCDSLFPGLQRTKPASGPTAGSTTNKEEHHDHP
ncbi:hypothetical protein [Desulfobulbus alkaliphilus]|uniref:hypothetical protein n=1 Tax=Desulfobulbus alkaliphilus TaxID=869814 RepID=UPI001963F4AB|nr:hypothetical protein [Desulfobulbus alkaliphilus]MBM9538706.1 hypothetical protein [Desulfobulbus alkaliphilus]